MYLTTPLTITWPVSYVLYNLKLGQEGQEQKRECLGQMASRLVLLRCGDLPQVGPGRSSNTFQNDKSANRAAMNSEQISPAEERAMKKWMYQTPGTARSWLGTLTSREVSLPCFSVHLLLFFGGMYCHLVLQPAVLCTEAQGSWPGLSAHSGRRSPAC